MLKRIYRWFFYVFSGFLNKDRYSGKIVEPHIFLEQVENGNVNSVEIGKLYAYAELSKPVGRLFKAIYVRTTASSVRGTKEMEKLQFSSRIEALEGI